MFDLEAYWQNRAIALGSTGNFTSAENGTSSTSYLQVRVVSVPSAETNNSGGLAADPAVYTTSDPAPPALQAIVTLNVTSGATLDLLLAALLDNTTGAWDGVNGTLASVTSQVASLGFDPPVLAALANAPIVSEGLYGTPPYKPTSHPSGGLWGEFWNAVSAVVTTPAGAILALVGEVWTVTLAVTTFLDHLAIEAAKIDGKLLSMSAAVLVAAGRVIVGVLDALLDHIVSLVKAALAAVINPIVNSAQSYFLGLNQSFTLAYDDVLGGHPVSAAHADSWWNSLGGSIFQGSLGLGVALEIALTLLTPFTLGASFLVPIVIPLIVSATLQGLAGKVPLVGSFTSVTGLSAAAVTMVWGVMNTTLNASRVPSTLLGTYLELGLADLGAFSLAWQILFASKAAGLAGLQVLGPLAVVILAALSLTADIVGKALGSPYIDWMGIVFGGIGAGLGLYTTLEEKDVSLKILTGTGALLSGFGSLIGFALVE